MKTFRTVKDTDNFLLFVGEIFQKLKNWEKHIDWLWKSFSMWEQLSERQWIHNEIFYAGILIYAKV